MFTSTRVLMERGNTLQFSKQLSRQLSTIDSASSTPKNSLDIPRPVYILPSENKRLKKTWCVIC